MSFVLARDPGFPPTQRMGCAPCSLHDSDGDLHACRISGASAQDRNPGGAVFEYSRCLVIEACKTLLSASLNDVIPKTAPGESVLPFAGPAMPMLPRKAIVLLAIALIQP